MCYLTTPEYMRSLRGRFVYAFQRRGTLALTDGAIVFACDAGGFELHLGRVRRVALGRFPLHVQLGLRYIDLTSDGGSVWLTPTHFRRLPVWHTNWVVADWYRRLDQALAAHQRHAEPGAAADPPRAAGH